jgi:hypothetical protein
MDGHDCPTCGCDCAEVNADACPGCEIEHLERRVAELESQLSTAQQQLAQYKSADFTGEPDQPPLEMIRARCVQMWDAKQIGDEELHCTFHGIHVWAVAAEQQLAECKELVRQAIDTARKADG